MKADGADMKSALSLMVTLVSMAVACAGRREAVSGERSFQAQTLLHRVERLSTGQSVTDVRAFLGEELFELPTIPLPGGAEDWQHLRYEVVDTATGTRVVLSFDRSSKGLLHYDIVENSDLPMDGY